jgi:hypothetical protein
VRISRLAALLPLLLLACLLVGRFLLTLTLRLRLLLLSIGTASILLTEGW